MKFQSRILIILFIFYAATLCLPLISCAQDNQETTKMSREDELQYFEKYKCRLIKSIKIKVVNPAGTSLNPAKLDTLPHRELIVNKLHSKSGPSNIKKLLLFRKNDFLEPSLLVDCQRYLRQNSSFNDALIVVNEIPGTDDVEITVMVQDKQSLAISGGLSDGRFFSLPALPKTICGQYR